MPRHWQLPTERKSKHLAVWLIAAGLILALTWLGVFKPLGRWLTAGVKPLLNGATGVGSGIKDLLGDADRRNLETEVSRLTAENHKLVQENAGLQYLREENRVLRKYVNLFDEAKYNYVLARVVSRSAPERVSGENNRLIVDKGAGQGIAPGLLVVNQEGLVVGKISAVKDNIAEVSLSTDSDCRLSVASNLTQKTIGVAEGRAGLTVSVNFIPQTEKLEAGQRLVTSGLEPDIPAGFVVGQVVRIDQTDNEIWQKAVMEPIADLDNLRIVSILLPSTR